MGAHRNVGLSELPLRGISINPEAGDVSAITVVASDSGVMFINKETGNSCTYTLPAVADGTGKMFWFLNAQDTKSTIINAPTSTMMMANMATASTATSAGDIGECGFVVCDGTNYYFFEIYGTWASA